MNIFGIHILSSKQFHDIQSDIIDARSHAETCKRMLEDCSRSVLNLHGDIKRIWQPRDEKGRFLSNKSKPSDNANLHTE